MDLEVKASIFQLSQRGESEKPSALNILRTFVKAFSPLYHFLGNIAAIIVDCSARCSLSLLFGFL